MAETAPPISDKEQQKQNTLRLVDEILHPSTIQIKNEGNVASLQAADNGEELTAQDVKDKTTLTSDDGKSTESLPDFFRDTRTLTIIADRTLGIAGIDDLGLHDVFFEKVGDKDERKPVVTVSPEQKLILYKALLEKMGSDNFRSALHDVATMRNFASVESVEPDWMVASLQVAALEDATEFIGDSKTDSGETKKLRRNRIYTVMRPTKDGLLLEGDEMSTVSRTLHLGDASTPLDFDTSEILTILNLGITNPEQYGGAATKLLDRIQKVFPDAAAVPDFVAKYADIVSGRQVDDTVKEEVMAQLAVKSGHAQEDPAKNFLASVIESGEKKKLVEPAQIAKSVREDLLGAQQIVNSFVPPEKLKEIHELEMQYKTADANDKDRIANELSTKRQTIYRAVLCANNVQPANLDGYDTEEGKIKYTDDEKALAEQIKERSVQVIEFTDPYDSKKRVTRRLDAFKVLDSNRIATMDMLYEYRDECNIPQQTFDKLKSYTTWDQLQMERSAISGVPAKEKDEDEAAYQERVKTSQQNADKQLDSIFHDTLGIDTNNPNYPKVRDVLVDRLNTDLRLRVVDQADDEKRTRFAQLSGGTIPENLSLTEYRYMGLKGIELLLRRSMYQPQTPNELKDVKIKLMQFVEGPSTDKAVQDVMDKLGQLGGLSNQPEKISGWDVAHTDHEPQHPPGWDKADTSHEGTRAPETPAEALDRLVDQIKSEVMSGKLIENLGETPLLEQTATLFTNNGIKKEDIQQKLKKAGIFKIENDSITVTDKNDILKRVLRDADLKLPEVQDADYASLITDINNKYAQLNAAETQAAETQTVLSAEMTSLKSSLILTNDLIGHITLGMRLPQNQQARAAIATVRHIFKPAEAETAPATITLPPAETISLPVATATETAEAEISKEALQRIVDQTVSKVKAGTFGTEDFRTLFRVADKYGTYQSLVTEVLNESSNIPINNNKLTVDGKEVDVKSLDISGVAHNQQLRTISSEMEAALRTDRKYPLVGDEVSPANLLSHLKAVTLGVFNPDESQAKAAYILTENAADAYQQQKIKRFVDTLHAHTEMGNLADFLGKPITEITANDIQAVRQEVYLRQSPFDAYLKDIKLPITENNLAVKAGSGEIPILNKVTKKEVVDLILMLNSTAKGDEQPERFRKAMEYFDPLVVGLVREPSEQIGDLKVRAAYTLALNYFNDRVISFDEPTQPVTDLADDLLSPTPTPVAEIDNQPTPPGPLVTDAARDLEPNAPIQAVEKEDDGEGEPAVAEAAIAPPAPVEVVTDPTAEAIAQLERQREELKKYMVDNVASLTRSVGARNLKEISTYFNLINKLYSNPRVQEYIEAKRTEKDLVIPTVSPTLFTRYVEGKTPGSHEEVDLLHPEHGLAGSYTLVKPFSDESQDVAITPEMLLYAFGKSKKTSDFKDLETLYALHKKFNNPENPVDFVTLKRLYDHNEAYNMRESLRKKAYHLKYPEPQKPAKQPQEFIKMESAVSVPVTATGPSFIEQLMNIDQSAFEGVIIPILESSDADAKKALYRDISQVLETPPVTEGEKVMSTEVARSSIVELLLKYTTNNPDHTSTVARHIFAYPEFARGLASLLKHDSKNINDVGASYTNLLAKHRTLEIFERIVQSTHEGKPSDLIFLQRTVKETTPELITALQFLSNYDTRVFERGGARKGTAELCKNLAVTILKALESKTPEPPPQPTATTPTQTPPPPTTNESIGTMTEPVYGKAVAPSAADKIPVVIEPAVRTQFAVDEPLSSPTNEPTLTLAGRKESILSIHPEFSEILGELEKMLTSGKRENIQELAGYLSARDKSGTTALDRSWKRFAISECLYELAEKQPSLVVNALRTHHLLASFADILGSDITHMFGALQANTVLARGNVIDVMQSLAQQDTTKRQVLRLIQDNPRLIDALNRFIKINYRQELFKDHSRDNNQLLYDECIRTQQRARLLLNSLSTVAQEKSPPKPHAEAARPTITNGRTPQNETSKDEKRNTTADLEATSNLDRRVHTWLSSEALTDPSTLTNLLSTNKRNISVARLALGDRWNAWIDTLMNSEGIKDTAYPGAKKQIETFLRSI